MYKRLMKSMRTTNFGGSHNASFEAKPMNTKYRLMYKYHIIGNVCTFGILIC